jgi:hypothetical protein
LNNLKAISKKIEIKKPLKGHKGQTGDSDTLDKNLTVGDKERVVNTVNRLVEVMHRLSERKKASIAQ